jgi:hypothetical protein
VSGTAATATAAAAAAAATTTTRASQHRMHELVLCVEPD